jgi:Gpi18-like mannosyltransferase
MIAFGLALSVKAQAVFLAPFLLLMAWKKRIPWLAFGLIPPGYLAAMLPAMLAGRSLWDVLTVYLNQAEELQILSHNAPNWYIFIPQSTYSVSMPIGILLAALLMVIWIYLYSRRSFHLKYEIIVFIALVSVAVMPFLLPKMHDRYFYPADVFSILLTFAIPELWFVSLGFQAVSGLAYSIFLFEAPRSTVLILATELNTILLAYLIWKQFILTSAAEIPSAQESTAERRAA